MSASNFIAFEAALTTTFVRLSATRLVGNFTLTNTHSTVLCYISVDGGTTKANILNRTSIVLSGVDLYDVWVAAVSGTLGLTVIGATRR